MPVDTWSCAHAYTATCMWIPGQYAENSVETDSARWPLAGNTIMSCGPKCGTRNLRYGQKHGIRSGAVGKGMEEKGKFLSVENLCTVTHIQI